MDLVAPRAFGLTQSAPFRANGGQSHGDPVDGALVRGDPVGHAAGGGGVAGLLGGRELAPQPVTEAFDRQQAVADLGPVGLPV